MKYNYSLTLSGYNFVSLGESSYSTSLNIQGPGQKNKEKAARFV